VVGEIAVKYEGRVNVIGLPVDIQRKDGSPDSAKISLAKDLMNAAGADFTNLLTSEEMQQTIMEGISVVPTTLFIDGSGNMTGKSFAGSKSLAEWSAIIDEML